MNVTHLWPQVETDDAPEMTWAAVLVVFLVALILVGCWIVGQDRQCQSLRHSNPAKATQVCGEQR